MLVKRLCLFNPLINIKKPTNAGEDIVDMIEVEFINPDGTTGSKIVSKLIDGKWTKYVKQT